MATERIIIENYKGIKKLDLEVRPFTVLIGPQSVGKSTTAKLLYFFKDIAREAIMATLMGADTSLDLHLIKRFLHLMPPLTREGLRSSIHYSMGKLHFALFSDGKGGSNWRIEIPKAFQDELASMQNELSELSKETDIKSAGFRFVSRHKFLAALKNKFGAQFSSLSQFIPAGRSFYAHLEKDPVSFYESATLDPFIAEFGKSLASLKEFLISQDSNLGDPNTLQRAAELGKLLLSGKYRREGQQDFIVNENEQSIPATLWSSGQQECFPLVLFLNNLCRGGKLLEVLFVEEPEVCLFPTSQRYMVELLALAFNAKFGSLNLFITTHSPYVLSTLNNLLRAGQLGGGDGSIVNPLEVLAQDSFGAYYMDQNECHSIIDEETLLIDGRGIDDVSGEIAEQFDALNSLQ